MTCSYQSLEAVSVKINSHDEEINKMRSNVHRIANEVMSVEILLSNFQKDIENIHAASVIVSDKIQAFKDDLTNRVGLLEEDKRFRNKIISWMPRVGKYLFFTIVTLSISINFIEPSIVKSILHFFKL